jgi:hypothetical protein
MILASVHHMVVNTFKGIKILKSLIHGQLVEYDGLNFIRYSLLKKKKLFFFCNHGCEYIHPWNYIINSYLHPPVSFSIKYGHTITVPTLKH